MSVRLPATRVTFALAVAGVLVGSPAQAQQSGVNVARYRFGITLPDTGKAIAVDATVEFQRAAGVDELRLDLRAPMRVRRARQGCDERSQRAVAFRHADDMLAVTLRPQGTDTITCVRIEYGGAPVDGLVITSDSAGRWRAFGDNWPNRARHWLASIDHPSDKALVEFRVTAPASRRVVANGAQQERTEEGRRATTRWTTLAPIPTYLMVIAAAPLAEHSLGNTACGLGSVGRCVPQRVFTAPEQARAMPGNFRFADDIVRFFARTIAPYPYQQLAHLQSSTRFGGMENAGAIFYADQLFRSAQGVSIGLIAHEVAHQWFGNAVTQREWGHLWLSEGFATYFAALYTQHAQGDLAFRREMAGIRTTVLASAAAAERPVLDTAETDLMALLNANSYQKGGYVLHMLRHEVGDSAFFRGVREYWKEHRHGNALTADLRAAVEREAGRDLAWFFDQWLTRPGFAQVSHTWAHDTTNGSVAIELVQGTRFPPFRFTLGVEVTSADGERQIVHVNVPAEPEVRLTLPGTWPQAPRAVRLDPHVAVLAEFVTAQP